MATNLYLLPTAEALADQELEDFIQAWLVGLTGLNPELVRPAFQEDPPPIPETGITWMAFTVKTGKDDWDSVTSFKADGDAPPVKTVTKFEQLDSTCSFYGPAAGASSMRLRMGAKDGPNLWPLQQAGWGFVSVSDALTVSEKIKARFVRRIDVELVLRRRVQFSYAVPEIVSVTGELIPDLAAPVPLSVELSEEAPPTIVLDPTNAAALAPQDTGEFGLDPVDFGGGDFGQ